MTLTRRDFVKLSGGAVSASMALLPGGEATAFETEPIGEGLDVMDRKRPNFLIILCDQMRFPPAYESGILKAFREQNLKTQNLLRANGVEFRRHYVASSASAPSRACILTGHYPSLHGVSQTYGGAKEACDGDVFWLDPNTVPTFGNYFRAAGYRTFWKGKWHVSDAEMLVPGTHDPIPSYDPLTGERDPDKEDLYVAADRLGPYGFAGWIGPEPHGPNPVKDTGSSARTRSQGRDAGFAEQTVELIRELDRDRNRKPWLVVCSFVNPHDIAVFSKDTADSGLYDFGVDASVPADVDLFIPDYRESHDEDLATKPSIQKSYAENYAVWGGSIPEDMGPHYRRFYYQLHKNLDEQMGSVMEALLASRFADDTFVVFASDHGEMLGAHGDLHQKMYQTYEETTRVPLIIWNRRLFKNPRAVETPTNHVDLAPTLLGLAGIDPKPIRKRLAQSHSDARPLVGRDLSPLILGRVGPDRFTDPVYVMIDDDPYKGLHMGGADGVSRPVIKGPKCIETVVARLAGGSLWRYSRYFDSKQYWSDPGNPRKAAQDILLAQVEETPDPDYEGPIDCAITVKGTPLTDEYELYDLTNDPMELINRYGDPAYSAQQAAMAEILAEQRDEKRLSPVSGVVPGQ